VLNITNKKGKMYLKLGVHSIEKAKRIRDLYKAFYGKEAQVKFRPRGKRIHIENGSRIYFQCSLPMRYAERLAIYIDITKRYEEE